MVKLQETLKYLHSQSQIYNQGMFFCVKQKSDDIISVQFMKIYRLTWFSSFVLFFFQI